MSSHSNKYTLDGSPALEAHIQHTGELVLAGVRKIIPANQLTGLLLGGGYGRGEGGVLRTPAGDLPYNDLEYYVFVEGNAVMAERRFRPALHALGESLSPAAALEVEFKVLTLDKLWKSPASMFYYDLVMGHRWLAGDDTLLSGCDHHRNGARIPQHEATRLLMNRCSGLLFALARLEAEKFTAEDADFVGRNLAKAQLGFGDVLLAAQEKYHWSCLERKRRVENWDLTHLTWGAALKKHHLAGVAFKLHPVRSHESREVLLARHQELTAIGEKLWLWLESQRLDCQFGSIRDYAVLGMDKCPETDMVRNQLVNVRAFGFTGLANTRYPRERLLNALPLLLWEKKALTDPFLRGKLQSGLRTRARNLAGFVKAYEAIWSRFN